MARINIEDEFWVDGRLLLLTQKFKGDRFAAIGQLVVLWRLAQDSFKKKKLMTEMQFKVNGLSDELIECGYAERRADGIYVRGSDEHFSWLQQRSDAGKIGGQKSAESRLKKAQAKFEEKQQLKLSKIKQVQPSSLLSSAPLCSSPLTSDLQKEELGVPRSADKQPAKPKEEPKTKAAWEKYREGYLAKHNSEPPQASAKDRSNLSSLIDRYGKDKAVKMVEHYFSLPNGYYHRNFHPIGVLLKDAHSIHGSMTTGKVMTRGQAQNMERSHETRSQMQRIENGEV